METKEILYGITTILLHIVFYISGIGLGMAICSYQYTKILNRKE